MNDATGKPLDRFLDGIEQALQDEEETPWIVALWAACYAISRRFSTGRVGELRGFLGYIIAEMLRSRKRSALSSNRDA